MNAQADTTFHSRRKHILPLLGTIAFALLVFAGVTRHENWYDESDAWLVARDASLAQLFEMTPAMGTPALWYLVLMPAAKLGLPIIAMGFINAMIVTAAIALLFFRAPFHWSLKLAFAFSFYAVFEFGVIARPYGLLMLLLFVVALLYPDRLRRPVAFSVAVALLANVTAHAIVIAGMIGAIYTWEVWRAETPRTTRHWCAIGIMLIGGLLAAWQIRPAEDSQLPTYASVQFPSAYLDVQQTLFYFPRRQLLLFGEASRLLAPLALAAVLVSMLDRPKILVIFLGALAWLMYVYHFKWFSCPRHSGVVLLLLISTFWMRFAAVEAAPATNPFRRLATLARRAATVLLTTGLALSWFHTAAWIAADWTRSFSEAPAMARWMREHVDPAELIVGDMFAGPVMANLGVDRRLWLAARREFGSYNTWTGDANRQNGFLMAGPFNIVDRAEATFPRGSVLMLLSYPLPKTPATESYRLIHSTGGRRIGYYFDAEQYFLYRRAGR